MEQVRLSVRGLVEWSVFPPDITPFSAALMEEGRLAHLARQRFSAARSEVPLQWEGREQGISFLISGRMDLLDQSGDVPLIEEIKLCRGEAPSEPRPEHRMQALCYAYIHCLKEGLPRADVRVNYASVKGETLAAFDERCDFHMLEQCFFSLLKPYAAWEKRMRRHRAKRDQSIALLSFPYPAFRAGQREMAAQVFTAISRRKRLFATMPTGTGKSAAVLYPALKAQGLKHCEQVFCLTARGTARRAMEQEIERMASQGLRIKSLTLNAREKLCPMEEVRCDPDYCPRAKGHYVRQQEALKAAMRTAPWDTDKALALSLRFRLCPFEFSLALSTLADVVICDYNYAFDPRVRLQRVFERPRGVCLLVDEAHNLPDRAREMLSGELGGQQLALLRRQAGQRLGRKGRLYRLLGKLLGEQRREEPEPAALLSLMEELMAALRQQPEFRLESGQIQELLGFLDALRRQAAEAEAYRMLRIPEVREQRLRLLCLDITPHLRKVSAPMSGFVCYSATLEPLDGMRGLLGGDEEDACFELPSPFPPENLLCLQLPLNTRFQSRQEGAGELAEAIRALYAGKPGKYIAFFPSYRYMQLVADRLEDLPLLVQESRMSQDARDHFLSRFTRDENPLLALCVLGGIFAEGVDLPGLALIGVCVVGVGLPQVGEEREAIRAHAREKGRSGFDIAYRYPGMHKVLQAAGRLIRSESDRGVLLLCDDRYLQPAYRRLLPPHYRLQPLKRSGELEQALRAFWAEG